MSAKFQVFFHTANRIARVSDDPLETPVLGEVKWGDFEHIEEATWDDSRTKAGSFSHVIFQHVQALAYKNGIQNTQSFSIEQDYKLATGITLADFTLEAGKSVAIQPVVTPANALHGNFQYLLAGPEDFAQVSSNSITGYKLLNGWQEGVGTLTVIDLLTGVKKVAKVTVKPAYAVLQTITPTPATVALSVATDAAAGKNVTFAPVPADAAIGTLSIKTAPAAARATATIANNVLNVKPVAAGAATTVVLTNGKVDVTVNVTVAA